MTSVHIKRLASVALHDSLSALFLLIPNFGGGGEIRTHEPVKVGGLVNRCNPKGPLWGSITCADVRRERDSNPRPDCSERQFSKLLH